MSHGDCWICTTAPGLLSVTILESLCQCGFALQYHGYGPPHPFAVVGCSGFTLPPRAGEAPAPRAPLAQPPLFA